MPHKRREYPLIQSDAVCFLLDPHNMHSVEDGLRFWEIKTAKLQDANSMKHKHSRLLVFDPQSDEISREQCTLTSWICHQPQARHTLANVSKTSKSRENETQTRRKGNLIQVSQIETLAISRRVSRTCVFELIDKLTLSSIQVNHKGIKLRK